jgi:hypothetical protein
MSAVIDFVEDVVGGVVEAVGDVVESVVDVVKDVGRAIDDYVIEPIKEDPLTFIATAAAATFLGPMAATTFGVKASVGMGIAAGAGNLAAGLVQGEEFDEALKGAVVAGATTFAGAEFFGGANAGKPAPTDSLDDFLAANNNFIDDFAAAPAAFNTPAVAPTSFVDDFATQAPAFADDFGASTFADDALAANTSPTAFADDAFASAPSAAPVAAPEVTSPLQSLNATPPPVDMPTFTSGLDDALGAPRIDSGFTPDYSLTSGMKPDLGLQVPKFTPADSLDIYGNPNYSMVPPGTSGGPGLQMPSAPNLGRMGGGQGLTLDMQGLPPYMEDGIPTTFTGESGKLYGNATPDVTVSSTGIRQTPLTTTYDATTNMGTPSLFDQVTSGNFTDAAKNVGGKAVDWVKNASPWEIAGVGLGAATLLGGAGGPPSATPPPRGSTQDANFNKSLDLYEFMRDKTNYAGDLNRYGQVGQATPGEHQFFQNTRFVPIPIPGQTPQPAKMGGLIQMKHYAQGGQVQGPQVMAQQQDPRRMQMMQAMAQQQGRPQGGMMPGRPQPQPGQPPQMPQQGQRQQMPQRPRNPKTAYYQYGNPPVQAKAMGGLSQVQSMKIGGGADGRSDDVNAVLSDGEYVFDAETVAMLGNGSSNAGAKKLDGMREQVRSHKGRALASGKISPDAKSPLAYLKGA